ncbi:hypothetical protein LGT39_06855 [Demequina sp. TTPB684]|uniref:PIN-like domain-containing protein n=1 Tax=unclassified Demequina TaxID=2620311 RepID=UPI001CF244B9|nr:MULTISPECIES: hypothetical protein [unclassified Demequina]MCB2412567.1 hypothetical protein [Demequina sp. TTPB684]UPU87547.1 hypothetical protein LGT36_009780 [Demequina sp. TMPB413]
MPHRFLIDRNLGTKVLPRALRGAGWQVSTLADEFGEARAQQATDEEWLQYAGERGLAVLMKDKRIRYRRSERETLTRFEVRAFCLSQGSLTGDQQSAAFLRAESRIMRACEDAGPFLYVLTARDIRRVEL